MVRVTAILLKRTMVRVMAPYRKGNASDLLTKKRCRRRRPCGGKRAKGSVAEIVFGVNVEQSRGLCGYLGRSWGHLGPFGSVLEHLGWSLGALSDHGFC